MEDSLTSQTKGASESVWLTVMWSKSLKVALPRPDMVTMRSECRRKEPLSHSQVPSGPAVTTRPSLFFT